MVSDQLWAALLTHSVCRSTGPEACLLVLAQGDNYANFLRVRPKSSFSLNDFHHILNILNFGRNAIDFLFLSFFWTVCAIRSFESEHDWLTNHSTFVFSFGKAYGRFLELIKLTKLKISVHG